jgi:hypothetical protein
LISERIQEDERSAIEAKRWLRYPVLKRRQGEPEPQEVKEIHACGGIA